MAGDSPYEYPIRCDVVDRPRGKCVRIFVCCCYDGELLNETSPIVEPIAKLPNDPDERRAFLRRQVEVRRTQLRKRHEDPDHADAVEDDLRALESELGRAPDGGPRS